MSKEYKTQENRTQPHFWIQLLCEEEEDPPLLQDIIEFTHDFNLIYEISRAATDPNYEFPLPQLSLRRDSGLYLHVRDEDRLHVERMRKESPFELVTICVAIPAAVGAIWGLVQTVEKAVNFRLNRKKLKEEVLKLERENSQTPNGSVDSSDSTFLFENRHFFERQLEQRGALDIYQNTSERLLRSKIQITKVSIEVRRISPIGNQPVAVNGPPSSETA